MRAGRSGVAAVAAALAVLLVGCAGGTGGGEPEPSITPDPPELDRDFPDPDVVEVDGTYYAYATNSATNNVQLATSRDLETWQYVAEDPLPRLPGWVIPGKTWAPEVTALGPGRYVMYFTATNFQPTVQCIGVATADDPLGPFTVQGEAMLVCPEEEGGAIDASTVRDEAGTLYLVWKNDGNCCGEDTWLQLAPLSADGLTLTGAPQRLLKQTQEWEGDVIEAPTILSREGRWYLFYSANFYGSPVYAIGLATADSLTGPWEKEDGPWLSSDGTDYRYIGPGGQDVVVGPDGRDHLVIHSYNGSVTERELQVLPLEWEDGLPIPVLD